MNLHPSSPTDELRDPYDLMNMVMGHSVQPDAQDVADLGLDEGPLDKGALRGVARPLESGVYPARVLKVYYDKTDATYWTAGVRKDKLDRRAIDVMLVDPYNYDCSFVTDRPRTLHGVMPDEVCPDQDAYHAVEGDIVWVKHTGYGDWFRTRWEPFVGSVTTVAASYVDVRMLKLVGDPDAAGFNGASLTELAATPTGTYYRNLRPGASVTDAIHYDFKYVRPLASLNNEPHQLQADDRVLVFQRGRYMLCVVDRALGWWGEITTAGPGGAANYADARYWVIHVEDQSAAGSAHSSPTMVAVASPITATNLGELDAGTHDVNSGVMVWVRRSLDQQASPVCRLVFSAAPGGGIAASLQWALITSAATPTINQGWNRLNAANGSPVECDYDGTNPGAAVVLKLRDHGGSVQPKLGPASASSPCVIGYFEDDAGSNVGVHYRLKALVIN
ncbi:MAG TPA: hypothetical protein VM238_18415 [Phycisphaerae bacterium]|nr:hypothetical protein [Phycisphaerae bacterium]